MKSGTPLVGQASYILYKFAYNVLFAVTIFYACMRPRDFLSNRHFFLVLPVFFVLPVILLSFPDTRFKIVYEVLALPALLIFARLAAQAISRPESQGRRA